MDADMPLPPALHYDVMRLPGAPARRAGRTWPEGEVVRVSASDLTPAQILTLESDAGYHVTRISGLMREPLAAVPARAQTVAVTKPVGGSPVRLPDRRSPSRSAK